MILNPAGLDAWNRRWERERLASLTYEDALRIYTALWVQAVELGWDGARDWQADIESDLAVARALNHVART